MENKIKADTLLGLNLPLKVQFNNKIFTLIKFNAFLLKTIKFQIEEGGIKRFKHKDLIILK